MYDFLKNNKNILKDATCLSPVHTNICSHALPLILIIIFINFCGAFALCNLEQKKEYAFLFLSYFLINKVNILKKMERLKTAKLKWWWKVKNSISQIRDSEDGTINRLTLGGQTVRPEDKVEGSDHIVEWSMINLKQWTEHERPWGHHGKNCEFWV